MTRKILAAALGIAVAATPLAANPAPVLQRVTEPTADESNLAADSNLFFIVGVAVVAAGVVLLQEDEEGVPASVG